MSYSDRMRTLTRLLSSCLVAIISVVMAVIITLNMGTIMKHTATLFFCSVMLSSWYGGLLPGFLAALLSVVALDYFFIPPLYALGICLGMAPGVIASFGTAFVFTLRNA